MGAFAANPVLRNKEACMPHSIALPQPLAAAVGHPAARRVRSIEVVNRGRELAQGPRRAVETHLDVRQSGYQRSVEAASLSENALVPIPAKPELEPTGSILLR
jgi:hypothetical protein